MTKKKNISRHILFFFQFLFLGIGLGIVEDVIAVYLASGVTITWHILLLITGVAIPFAAVGELLIDRIDVPFLQGKAELFVEFFVFGFVVGVIEDLLAIFIATGEPITAHTFLIAGLVALPFAAFSELIVDRLDLMEKV